tara:strand:+ start:74 stop:685 length:612 start_codon:yes stop_codon:yes gene_type:complete
MANEGFTVTPSGFTDEATGQFVTTGHDIVGTHHGEKTRLEEVEQQQERWVENPEDGSVEYNDKASAEDLDNLVQMYGGQEEYQAVEEWSTSYYDEADIELWNQIVERGDLSEIAEAIEYIKRDYDSRDEDVEFADDADVSDQETVDYIFSEVVDRDHFNSLVEYAAQHLDDTSIEQFNTIVESGNREQIIATIRCLNDWRYRQ